MTTPWNTPTTEPSLKEMLDDPIVRLVMRRDRLAPEYVVTLLHETRARLMARTLARR